MRAKVEGHSSFAPDGCGPFGAGHHRLSGRDHQFDDDLSEVVEDVVRLSQ
jgi:hypothetical protein